MSAETLAVDQGIRPDESRDEWLEERAAILEHDAGHDRPTAERIAKRLWVSWQATHWDEE